MKFVDRHIGPRPNQIQEMLQDLGVTTLDALMEQTIPTHLRNAKEINIGEAKSESEMMEAVRALGTQNILNKQYIGMGYSETITPAVIQRNIFENPGWYTQYTPYQAEIAQGRLEMLLNFQTMVCDLTDLPISNASLLDEATAAGEGMSVMYHHANKKNRKPEDKRKVFFIDEKTFPQTIAVIEGRAMSIGIEVEIGKWSEMQPKTDYFGVLIQFPNMEGGIEDYKDWVAKLKQHDILCCVATDLLSLCMLESPSAWGADIIVGNTQRFGVPLGAGGPHAAYFACKEEFKRLIPGRIIGISKDAYGAEALRMALQTREQHIRRERASSNICTAQALLAIMAAAYAIYHGPEGLRSIAQTVHSKAKHLASELNAKGYPLRHTSFFDTISIPCEANEKEHILNKAYAAGYNLNPFIDGCIGINLSERTTDEDVAQILACFESKSDIGLQTYDIKSWASDRTLLNYEVFQNYHSETALMRYLKSLENKDLSLTHAMIPLGSCTMKLNAAAELIPCSNPYWMDIHPFAPANQQKGYQQLIDELSEILCNLTDFAGCTFNPNSGAQGELTGLMMINAYHQRNNQSQRKVVLIPSSAHGTNPASAVMAGLKVVVVNCDAEGNILLDDLASKALEHKDELCGLMITYPSTHGVFEEEIKEVLKVVHTYGGLVYMDGANMNAQIGYSSPGAIGADVCHLNLHKTFAIPHGGGGPGMGPVCCNEKLKPFLPQHPLTQMQREEGILPVAAAPNGSALILIISYIYCKLLGTQGLKSATEAAVLNANYLLHHMKQYYDILYTGANGRCAHEFIVDLRAFKEFGIEAEDVAKRLIDYGFHAPTMSFPVPGTIMIEPTESEPKEELDRFIASMLCIREEINEVEREIYTKDENVLVNAPHPIQLCAADEWPYAYTRAKAAYPMGPSMKKFWIQVGRIDNAYGDRNLICSCPPIEAYQM